MSEVLDKSSLALPSAGAAADINRLDRAGGLVHVADLEWPLFDPEESMTFSQYVSELGDTLTELPRETSTKDSPLQLYGNDFMQASVPNLDRELYIPHAGAQKSVTKVREWRPGLNRSDYPGREPFHVGVAVSEDVYEEIVKNAAYFANQIYNRTVRKNTGKLSVEEVADLGGESVVYALADKHEVLKARNQDLIERNSVLNAVHRSIVGGKRHRIGSMEPYRLDALATILDVAKVACKRLGYGNNQTNSTLRAVASNTHRSAEADQWWTAYAWMAYRYNEEVRGKVAQSIQSCVDEIGNHAQHLFNNVDREYTGK